MQNYTVEVTFAIDAMNEESAENKLDTFLSALDLKKNDKITADIVGELTQVGKSTKKATKSKKADPEEDEEDDEDWDDEWATGDWDSLDEDDDEDDDDEDDDEDEDADDDEDADEDEEESNADEDELSKLLSNINSPTDEEELVEEPEAPAEEADEDWGEWDDDASWDWKLNCK